MEGRHALRRLHVWLGWLVGIPLLIWTATGLFMVWQPIERVRGEHLVGPAPELRLAGSPVPPAIQDLPLKSLTLEQQPRGPVWIARFPSGAATRADAVSGRWLGPLTPVEAVELVRQRYRGESTIVAVDRTARDAPPVELRREVESYRVSFADGTRFYVDRSTGEILARRTALWRVFDFMWGLHIMDLDTREDINNPWVIGFAAVSVLAVLLALLLLPSTIRRRSGHRWARPGIGENPPSR